MYRLYGGMAGGGGGSGGLPQTLLIFKWTSLPTLYVLNVSLAYSPITLLNDKATESFSQKQHHVAIFIAV